MATHTELPQKRLHQQQIESELVESGKEYIAELIELVKKTGKASITLEEIFALGYSKHTITIYLDELVFGLDKQKIKLTWHQDTERAQKRMHRYLKNFLFFHHPQLKSILYPQYWETSEDNSQRYMTQDTLFQWIVSKKNHDWEETMTVRKQLFDRLQPKLVVLLGELLPNHVSATQTAFKLADRNYRYSQLGVVTVLFCFHKYASSKNGSFTFVGESRVKTAHATNVMNLLTRSGERSVQTHTTKDIAPNSDLDNTVGLYLEEMRDLPLLTPPEAEKHFQTLQQGRVALVTLHTQKETLPPEKIAELQESYQLGQEARRILIHANLRLVIKIAKLYQNRGVPFGDLVQHGNMGLIRAVDKFDITQGFLFSTYATYSIHQKMREAVALELGSKADKVSKIGQLLQAKSKLTTELGREPSVQELAAELSVTNALVEELLVQISHQSAHSLEEQRPSANQTGTTPMDRIADESSPSPAETLEAAERFQLLQSMLDSNRLSPLEKSILKMLYGLTDDQKRTIEEVGKVFGIDREQVKQLRRNAIQKIRIQFKIDTDSGTKAS